MRALADRELLASVLGVGGRGCDVLEVSGRLLKVGLAGLSRATVRELAVMAGLGVAQATRLAAAFELGRRAEASVAGPVLRDSAAIARTARARLRGEREEVVLALLLSARLRLLRVVEVARGGPAGAVFSPAEALAPALREGAPRLALAHNHPGGDPSPSAGDATATARLVEAARVVGVDLVDHVIVTSRAHFSFADLDQLRPAAPRPGRRRRGARPARGPP